ncbi:response regulator transcription factor [Colwellia echini]|uniref:Response regulator transcription factor n=1 Tax=Colwellia echini TaxID=1982103 RepID=A0ABY3MWE0_9GAMM|nr:response regulator transcription factor [Colwellia echini]TYK65397.1 response regulator transcription factor [Colwellia echini]
MSKFTILLIEDDKVLNCQLNDLLIAKGYKVEQCFDGEQGLIRASSQQHHLILLDVMLPERDGFSLLKVLRKSCQTPVIMVTAKDAEQEKILGFSHGADDYVAKPFNPTELLFRIEAILRRSHDRNTEIVSQEVNIDGLTINYQQQLAFIKDDVLDLTPIQLKLLWELAINKGEVLSKAYLYQRVLNRNIGAYDRSLDMHLSRVRRRLNEANWQGERLQTSHGKGYCLV